MSEAKTENWVTENVSPYKLASILSEVLQEEVAPQTMYQARRNGKLAVETNELGHYFVTPKEGNRFIQARLDRIAEVQAKAEAEAEAAAEEAEEVPTK
jgi:hypothetical protein